MLPLIERSVAEHDALRTKPASPACSAARAGSTARAARRAWISRRRGRLAVVLRLEASGAGPPGADGAGAGPVRAHGRWGPLAGPGQCRIRERSRAAMRPLLQRRGGGVRERRRAQPAAGWRRLAVDTADGPLRAREAVVALGPWSTDVLRPLGYRVPMAVKRGYHQHFALERGARLTRPVADIDNGFVMTPMTLGLRLTTGAEFASRDAPPTPVQIGRVRALAGQLVPLGAAVEAQPWMGCRFLHAGHASGDRPGAEPRGAMAAVRPRASWFHAGPCDRPAAGQPDHGRGAGHDPAPTRCAVEARRGVWRVRPCRRALRGAGAPPWPACPAPARSATSPGRRR